MASRPRAPAKERSLVRIMEIDVEVVWEQKLHETERILRPGTLPDDAIAGFLCPLHVIPLQITRIGFQTRENFILEDSLRWPPVGPEDDPSHRIAEHRRRMSVVLRADHDLHGQDSLPAIERVEMKGRYVHVDVSLSQRARQPTMALQVGADLSRSGLSVDVQSGEGGAAQFSIGLEVVSSLPRRENHEDRVLRRHRVTFCLESSRQLLGADTRRYDQPSTFGDHVTV